MPASLSSSWTFCSSSSAETTQQDHQHPSDASRKQRTDVVPAQRRLINAGPVRALFGRAWQPLPGARLKGGRTPRLQIVGREEDTIWPFPPPSLLSYALSRPRTFSNPLPLSSPPLRHPCPIKDTAWSAYFLSCSSPLLPLRRISYFFCGGERCSEGKDTRGSRTWSRDIGWKLDG